MVLGFMASNDVQAQPPCKRAYIDAFLTDLADDKSSQQYTRLQNWVEQQQDWAEFVVQHFKLTKGQATRLSEVAKLVVLLLESTARGSTEGISQALISEERVKAFRLSIKRRLYNERREEVTAVSQLPFHVSYSIHMSCSKPALRAG
jgi:hypothetical protein